MSTTFISVFVMLATTILPKFGITVGDAELTTTIQTIIYIGGCLWIAFKRHQTGDIKITGVRK
jgi:uncharacterized membrane protein